MILGWVFQYHSYLTDIDIFISMSERKDRYEEQRNDLIKSADKSVINDRAQIAVLKSRIIKFRDTAPENIILM